MRNLQDEKKRFETEKKRSYNHQNRVLGFLEGIST